MVLKLVLNTVKKESRECAATLIHQYFVFIYGRHVTFVTNHQPLVTIRKLKEPMGRIGNLLNKLQDCDYDLVYQPGAIHFVPDMLSRPAKVEVKTTELCIETSVNWVVEQETDSKIKNVVNFVTARVIG